MNRAWMGRFLLTASLACLGATALVFADIVEGVDVAPPPPAPAAVEAPPARGLAGPVSRALRKMFAYPRRLKMLLPSRRHLPDHLAHREHWDYPGPLQWVPRGWTTYGWGKPRMVLGNQARAHDGAPKPIGERGSFQISVYPDLPPPFCWLPVYAAFTLPNGLHFRVGARWDDVDSYVNLPSVAIKKKVK